MSLLKEIHDAAANTSTDELFVELMEKFKDISIYTPRDVEHLRQEIHKMGPAYIGICKDIIGLTHEILDRE